MASIAFERSHSVLIDAPAQLVLNYVSNPQSWKEWMPATHDMDCPDRPLLTGERFTETWATRNGEVVLEWEVTDREDPMLWCARTHTDFTGPIQCQYSVESLDPEHCRYTRAILNPARLKAPTKEMIERMDKEAELCLANIKRVTEEQVENAAVVSKIKAEGVAVLALLTPEELEAARSDMDKLYRETHNWLDEEHHAERQLYDPPPEAVNALPGLARLFSHPRVTAILSEVMGEPPGGTPFLQAMRTDRYLAGHKGVSPHQDGGSQFALPYEKMATMIFLDDIGEDSGALEYVPGSHLRQMLRSDGSAPAEMPLPGGRCAEIDESYARGDFKAVVLKAGSVVFRVPCVWHAVRPVHRLRRYVTGRYFVRAPAARIDDSNGGIEQVVAERSTPDAMEVAAGLPSGLRVLLDPSGVFVEPTVWAVGQLCEVRGADGEWHAGKIYEKVINADHQQSWKITTRSDATIIARSDELRAHTDSKM